MRKLNRTLGWCGLVVTGWLAGQAVPGLFAQAQVPGAQPAPSDVVAVVNDVPITRQELADEIIARKGKEQLQLLINRKIIYLACAQVGISVSDEEIEEDLRATMRAAKINTKLEFEQNVLSQKKISLYEYLEDVVRPAIAMRKLAANKLTISEDELKRAFEAGYGEKVRCRVILEPHPRAAHEIHAQVKSGADAFIRAAKQQSDGRLAAVAGEIPPISRMTPLGREVENEAFRLKDGEVSHLIQTKEGYVILLREGTVPADTTKRLEDVHVDLRKTLIDDKLRAETPKLFLEMKKNAKVVNFLANPPGDLKNALEGLTNTAPTTNPARGTAGKGGK